MKKYLLSFGLILVFAFYMMMSDQSTTAITALGNANSPSGGNNNSTTTATPPIAAGNSVLQTIKRTLENEFGDDDGARRIATTSIPALRQTPPPTTPTPAPTPSPTPTPTPTTSNGQYKNGTYAGPVTDAYYGPMQVQAVVKNGQLADVQVLQYPNDRGTSQSINGAALPQLVQEAIQAQSANVNIVSGATQSSEAFAQSLASALAQAKA